MRLVGIGTPRYSAKVHDIPLVSWLAAKQQMQFAAPNDALFCRAFMGADVVHVYMPFRFGRRALSVAKSMGLPVTAGFHLQPENITYSSGPLRYVPGLPTALYHLFDHWLYRDVGHIHAPSRMIATQLRVISNGYSDRFHPNPDMPKGSDVSHESDESFPSAPSNDSNLMHAKTPNLQTRRTFHLNRPFRIVASGRLSREKDYETLIRAVAQSRYVSRIDLTICGTGPLKRYLNRLSGRLLPDSSLVHIGFHSNDEMPNLLRQADLLVHPSIVDIESLSVLEAITSGLVPVLARSSLSAADQFALVGQSLFPAHDATALAARIDWWIEHPAESRRWSSKYAEEARENYSIAACVSRFVAMEREAIRDAAG